MAAASITTATNDTFLPADAQDTISCISWSPTALHLASASWDGHVRIYDVKQDGSQAQRVAEIKFGAGAPLLSCDWTQDGTALLAAGADKMLYLLHAATGQTTLLGDAHHSGPIRVVRRVPIPNSTSPTGLIATGSWDRTVSFWDPRTSSPIATLPSCAERVHALDASDTRMVIATAGDMHAVDLRRPHEFACTAPSPLAYLTRAVGVAPGGNSWAMGSVEGRVAVQTWEEEKGAPKSGFSFRCHRTTTATANKSSAHTTTHIYSVNDVRFHPTQHATFLTAGSDGVYTFWDSTSRVKNKSYAVPSSSGAGGGDDDLYNAITATGFSASGGLLAYATGYDWSQGFAVNVQGGTTRLLVHRVTPEDAKSKKQALLRR